MKRSSLLTWSLAAAVGLFAAACSDQPGSSSTPTGVIRPQADVSSAPKQQDWKQCENDHDLASACDWVTSNLGAAHNLYHEGDVVPHVLRIGDITSTGALKVVFTVGFKKAHNLTFDFPGTFHYTMANANPCTDGTFNTATFCTAGALKPISASSPATGAGSARQAALSGTNLTASDLAELTAAMNAFNGGVGQGGNSRVQGINITSITVDSVSYDYGANGDVEARYAMTVVPTTATEALILFGTHIARTIDYADGGAGGVNGSPYHVSLESVGSQGSGSIDLQMSAAAVVIPPALSIVKTPDAQTVAAGNNISFSITVSNATGAGAATGVALRDTLPGGTGIDWSTTSSGCSISGTPPNEILSCTIGELAAGASFSATVTSGTTGGSCGVYNNTAWFNSTNGGTGSDAGQNTVNNCTGNVTIVKNTIGGNGTFNFTAGGLPLQDFSLATVGNTASQGPTAVPVGTYVVTENALSASWEFVSVVCTGNGAGGTTSSTSSQAATIVVGLGANVTCTFTNRKKGTITIVKNTVGGDSTFAFTHDISGATPASPFGIATSAGTASQAFTNLSAGTYHVTESGPAGSWEFVSASCTAGGSISGQQATIVLPAGGDITCTFNNRKKARLIIEKKVTTGSSTSALFDFDPTSNWNGDANFQLAHNGTKASALLTPGTYGAAEIVPAGWSLTSRVCVRTAGSGAAIYTTPNAADVSVALAAGQEVTCTFTNDELGTLIVEKQIPGTNLSTFDFTRSVMPASVTGSFTLGDGQNSSTGKKLNSGNYTVCETVPAGWQDPVASINGGAGQAGSFDNVDTFCWSGIAVAKGGTTTVVVTNRMPPGTTRTIGYWRNWSSCTNGKQWEKSLANDTWNKTLDGNLPQTVGMLLLAGAPGADLASPDCLKAFNILSKRDIGGTNQANDAAYNMAAQYLGALLNVSAGAGSCAAADAAIIKAQQLLSNTLPSGPSGVLFTGSGAFLGKGANASLVNLAKSLAGTLGSYNEGTLGGGCPTHAN